MKKLITLFFVSIVGIGVATAQSDPNKLYHITLPGNYLQYILDKLSERPMKEVYPVVTSISNQINAQDAPLKTDSTAALKPKTDSISIKHKK